MDLDFEKVQQQQQQHCRPEVSDNDLDALHACRAEAQKLRQGMQSERSERLALSQDLSRLHRGLEALSTAGLTSLSNLGRILQQDFHSDSVRSACKALREWCELSFSAMVSPPCLSASSEPEISAVCSPQPFARILDNHESSSSSNDELSTLVDPSHEFRKRISQLEDEISTLLDDRKRLEASERLHARRIHELETRILVNHRVHVQENRAIIERATRLLK